MIGWNMGWGFSGLFGQNGKVERTVKAMRKTPDITEILLREIEGVKEVTQFSSSTITFIRREAPLFDKDLFNARAFVKRKGNDLGPVKARFPRLAGWYYDDELKTDLSNENQRSINSCVNECISKRTGLPSTTIARYRLKRNNSTKK